MPVHETVFESIYPIIYGPLKMGGGTFTFTFSHLADAFIQSDLQLENT